jgi:DnaK suppressor protein
VRRDREPASGPGGRLFRWRESAKIAFCRWAKGAPFLENETVENTSPLRDALLRKRAEILAAGSAAKPIQQAGLENNSRQGDLADQAAGNNEVHIQLKLKQVDAKILQAIEEALRRLEKGTYGICRDCGEPIAPARLKAIPWTRVCITCKEKQSA